MARSALSLASLVCGRALWAVHRLVSAGDLLLARVALWLLKRGGADEVPAPSKDRDRPAARRSIR